MRRRVSLRTNGYLLVVVMLAVLTVMFGVMGTVAPPLANEGMAGTEQSSLSDPASVAHFQNPPSFDSGWVDISDKAGQHFSITHGLNRSDVFVDVLGRQSADSKPHKMFFGGTTFIEGWNSTFGGAGNDYSRSMIEAKDGSYVSAGTTKSSGAGNGDFWLLKVEHNGSIIWSKTYGGAGGEEAWKVVETSDGGYAIAGYTYSFGAGGYDFYLVKTSSNGTLLWSRTYGGANNDLGYSLVQTRDGGYAIVGDTSSFGVGSDDFWLVKTDEFGNAVWNKTFGGVNSERARSIIQCSDGGYVIAGSTSSVGAGLSDFWLVKTDSDGSLQWSKTYGGMYYDVGWSVVVDVNDGGYAVAGSTNSFGSGGYDFWLVKTYAEGSLKWSEIYGGVGDDQAYSVVQKRDGAYAIAGKTSSSGAGGDDLWLVLTNPDHPSWLLSSWAFGGVGNDCAYSVVEPLEGGFALAGDTSSFGSGGIDSWLFRIAPGEVGSAIGLSMTGLSDSAVSFYRGSLDGFWRFIQVRIWIIEEPSWQYGDINMDGVVDGKDLYILGRNYGKSLSVLSFSGIVGVASLQRYRKRRRH